MQNLTGYYLLQQHLLLGLLIALAFELLTNFGSHKIFVHNWPVPLPHLISLIAFMSIKKMAFSTARLYIACISALHKLRNLSDSTAHFLICKLLEGFRRGNAQQAGTRGPITYRLLVKVINVLPSIWHSHYEFLLFKLPLR